MLFVVAPLSFCYTITARLACPGSIFAAQAADAALRQTHTNWYIHHNFYLAFFKGFSAVGADTHKLNSHTHSGTGSSDRARTPLRRLGTEAQSLIVRRTHRIDQWSSSSLPCLQIVRNTLPPNSAIAFCALVVSPPLIRDHTYTTQSIRAYRKQ